MGGSSAMSHTLSPHRVGDDRFAARLFRPGRSSPSHRSSSGTPSNVFLCHTNVFLCHTKLWAERFGGTARRDATALARPTRSS